MCQKYASSLATEYSYGRRLMAFDKSVNKTPKALPLFTRTLHFLSLLFENIVN